LREEAIRCSNLKLYVPEEDQLLHEQIRGAHEDRDRTRRKLTKRPESREEGIGAFLADESAALITARVIRSEGMFFMLRSHDGKEIRAKTYKGTRSANPSSTLAAVGDEVRVTNHESGYLIEEVSLRRTKLSRRAAGRRSAFEQVIVANVDLLVIVASVSEPKLRSGIIDRYIVAAIEGGLDIAIAINKIDAASPEEMDEALYFRDLYREIGYPVHLVSASKGTGIPELKEEIAGKTSVFAGHSGVGKSSLVNAILGREAAQTGVLQKKFRRGAHTTAASTLIEVPQLSTEGHPAYIADTPGVREFANFELRPADLKFAFVEFQKFQERCAITNCSHTHEPGCAVRQAVEEDKISIDRYTNYQKLLGEAQREENKRIRNQ
jgi:ribosome biogenesis GTPase / thiamine phosphate phosphatase